MALFLESQLLVEELGEVGSGDLVVGAKPDRGHEMGASLRRFPMQRQKDTEIAMSLEVRGVQRDRLSKLRLGVLPTARFHEETRQMIMQPGILGNDLDRRAHLGDRGVQVPPRERASARWMRAFADRGATRTADW